MKLKYLFFISLLSMLVLGIHINVYANDSEDDTVLVTFMADMDTVIKEEEVKKEVR